MPPGAAREQVRNVPERGLRTLLAGFDVEAAAAVQHPACALLPAEADAHGAGTFVWHRARPFPPERLRLPARAIKNAREMALLPYGSS